MISNTITLVKEEAEAPRRKRWTRQEFHQMGDMGLLPGHNELIDGEILEKIPKNPPHVIALMLLSAWLETLFGRYFVRTQDPVVIPVSDEFSTEPDPDFAVTRAATTTYITDNPGPDDLLLVREVSDLTLNFDLRNKANLCGAAGIPEYRVLDVMRRKLYVHRLPSPEGYREIRIYSEDEQVATLARPNDTVLLRSLLPPVENA